MDYFKGNKLIITYLLQSVLPVNYYSDPTFGKKPIAPITLNNAYSCYAMTVPSDYRSYLPLLVCSYRKGTNYKLLMNFLLRQ